MSGKERNLKLSGENYKAVFNALPHSSYIWQKVGEDLILIEYNAAAAEITEGKVRNLIGIKASELYQEKPNVLKDFEKCLREKIEISRETTHKYVTTGKERVLNRFYDFIEPDLVLVHTEDITKQKLAEQSLKKEEQEKSMILGAVSDHIIYYDTEQNIIWANQAAIDSVNLSYEEVVGQKCYKMWQNRREPCEICPVLRALDTGKTQTDEVRTPDGRIWFISGFLVRDDNGNIIGMVEITRDITAQKYVEDNLRRERDILGRITDTSPVGISVVNKVGHIIFANPQAEKILGLTKDEITQRTYNAPSWKITDYDGNIFPDDELPFQKVKSTRESIFDMRHAIERPNGQKRYLSINASPIFDENGNFDGMIATIEDITEKWITEKKLKESEKKYRYLSVELETILDLIPGLVYCKDKNDVITRVNQIFADSLKLNKEDIIGKTTFDFFPSEQAKKYRNDDLEVITSGKPKLNIEESGDFPDGKMFTITNKVPQYNAKGEIVGVIGLTIDITKQKIAEQKLNEKNIELSALNRIIALGNESQSLREFLEKSYDQVLDIVGFDRGGVYLYDYNTKHNILILHKNIHPDFIAAVEDVDISEGLFKTIFDKNKPFYIEDFSEFMENSKELGVYSAVIVPLRSKDEYVGSLNIGSPVHQVLTDNELELLVAIGKQMGIIIQKFESENLLKKSEEKYRKAYNRISLYKDLFTHDINNIFQNILSSNELAMLYSNVPEKLQDYVEVANLIKEQVSRGAKLVSNVQKLSELEEFKKPLYSIGVCSVLNNVTNSIKKNFLHKQINTSFHSPENQYLIKANELIFDVFENIMINAVKHNKNPTIEIQIKISKTLMDNVKYVKIEFIDNGIGIPDIMKNVIFQRDYKEDQAGGIGLGLLLIKRILESYDGTVKVEDKTTGDYSKGSNFIILIPEA